MLEIRSKRSFSYLSSVADWYCLYVSCHLSRAGFDSVCLCVSLILKIVFEINTKWKYNWTISAKSVASHVRMKFESNIWFLAHETWIEDICLRVWVVVYGWSTRGLLECIHIIINNRVCACVQYVDMCRRILFVYISCRVQTASEWIKCAEEHSAITNSTKTKQAEISVTRCFTKHPLPLLYNTTRPPWSVCECICLFICI